MFIKNIIISGFRSYREQKFEEDLSRGHNVIVGPNGSGKSNFFAAMQFVLSEKYANLRPNERQDLFHAGAGRPSLSVYVEITFDNSDGRIIIPSRDGSNDSEVRIRRILGLKQDEFRVNDRKYSAEDVRQLLEGAGFSSSNPYYIVEQGKIVHLANMSEASRYELLKDVAGTKVYEARREESQRLLEDTRVKEGKIQEAINMLDDRLRELDAESSELKQFQEADRKRKSIEYCIFRTQETEAREQLDTLNANWETRIAGNRQNRDDEAQIEMEAAAAEVAVEQATHRMRRLEDDRKGLEKEVVVLSQRHTQLKLRIADAASVKSRCDKEHEALERELVGLEKRISEVSEQLTSGKTQLSAKQRAYDSSIDNLSKIELRLEALQAKRGRKQQFKTRAERDKWIHSENKRNTELVAANTLEIGRLNKELEQCKMSYAAEAKALKEGSSVAKQSETSTASTEKDRSAIVERRDKFNLERRRLWQQVNEQESVVRGLAESNDRARARMDRATRNDIRQGLQSLHETLNEHPDRTLAAAVHGRLIELMSVDPKYLNAIEVTVGNALFNVVVDSFDVATKLLDYINRTRKPGRVTFFPLDTSKAKPRDIPTNSEYSSLLSHVQFDKKFTSVFAELMGRTAVATSLEVGARVVTELDCDVVTIDGDQFNRKGGITGGYFDNRNLKIAAFNELQETSTRLNEERKRLDVMCDKVSDIEKQITAAVQQLENLTNQDVAQRTKYESGRTAQHVREGNMARLTQQMEQISKSIEVLRRSNVAVEATNTALQQELVTEMSTTLSAAEEEELNTLASTVEKTRNEAAAKHGELVQLATEVQLHQDKLRHLERRVNDVKDNIENLKSTTTTGNVTVLSRELSAVEADKNVLVSRIADIDRSIDAITSERRSKEEEAQTLRRKVVQATRDQQREKDAIDAAHNERALLLQRKEDAISKIRALGVVPSDAEANYRNYSIGRLMLMLRTTNDELKKYAHVNKKALDQYTTVAESRTGLTEQLEALAVEHRSIINLMKKLDDDKGKFIERTFKQVQFNFEEVFKEIVMTVGAKAELKMVKNTVQNSLDPYVAVRIEACFGLGAPVTELAQLSGGQKSLVALALIFAIQRCDPAPFYLFDEIDAALDAEYRTSVAQMLQRQSSECQFITATFKEEMLDVSDKVLGISFKNKVSNISIITKEDGKRILAQVAANDERNKRVREEDHENSEV